MPSARSRLLTRLLCLVSASGASLAAQACGARTEPPDGQTSTGTSVDGQGGAGQGGSSQGASGQAGTAQAGQAGHAGKAGQAGSGGSSGKGGAGGSSLCGSLPPPPQPDGGAIGCPPLNNGQGFDYCDLFCTGPVDGACPAANDPGLPAKLNVMLGQTCGYKDIPGGPYCKTGEDLMQCCYLVRGQACAGRPLLVGLAARLAPLARGSSWA